MLDDRCQLLLMSGPGRNQLLVPVHWVEDLSSCSVIGAHLPDVHICPPAFVLVTYILRRSTVLNSPASWTGFDWLRPLLVIAVCQPLDWHGIQWCPRAGVRSFRLIS